VTPVETPVKAPVETQVKDQTGKLGDVGDALLTFLAACPDATLVEAAAQLGESGSAIERAARRLRERGRLRYVGPRQGGHWEVI
jgi:predicted HTH transcriptional regulator